MATETTREERKARYLAKVSSLAGRFEEYDEIMEEASKEWDKKNQ